ncbi:serine hydrolase domain-containing protein [Telluribacter sp.]|jgi:CubicO group peptidase (beta-lactamase class C family)|uniref:serine hydrolase domain-containing protein n=1 Tax=Telluribacter sp. TaxID=1978767 RepID=UPI002E1132EB|nr:serine hydrolase domain-containing protein [Telluribacter sp.]
MTSISTRTWLLLFLLAIVAGSCFPEPEPVEDFTFTDSTMVRQRLDVSAVAATIITDAGSGTVLRYGHVWSDLNEEPTTREDKTEFSKAITALPFTYNSTLTGLLPNTTYYVRAYLELKEGIAYGPVTTFQTQAGFIDRLAATLEDSLQNRDFGYSFAIFEKSELVASGSGGLQSRVVEAAGELPFTLDSRMQIASMSKTLTAMAFLKLATEKRIDPKDPITNYLPPSWKKGTNLEKITFHDLLTHRSGIIGLQSNCRNGAYTENYWYGLKNIVAKGIQPEHYGNYCYQNANFGLFRVLIPALLGYNFTGNDQTDDTRTQELYEEYLQKNIFEKAGLTTNLWLNNSPQSPTFGYDYPYTGSRGFNPGNFAASAGAYGVYLSAREAATVYARVLSTTDQAVLSSPLKETLLTNGYGAFSTVTPDGRFSYHDGWWYITTGGGRAQGFRSAWIKGPNDVTVVLLTNALRTGDNLFPLKSARYLDIVSFLLWAHSEAKVVKPQNRPNAESNFHDYLDYPEPH